MKGFGRHITTIRQSFDLSIKDFANRIDVHPSLVSRIEQGDRLPTKKQLEAIIDSFDLDRDELQKSWLAEKVVKIFAYSYTTIDPGEVMTLAESRIEYLQSKKALDLPSISPSIQSKLDVLDRLHQQWQSLKPLTGIALQKMREYFNTSYTYESNRIEGNTLTLQETALVVKEGITISGKSMTEHLEAINHAEAVDFIIDLIREKEILDRRSLMELHGMILRGIDRENAGRYRQVPVRISGSTHLPPQPYLLDKLMEDYFINYHQIRSQIHPVILAAEMHERLVSIHPFIDGNGRTSRLIMNCILLQHGYTIAILKGDYDSRMRYYKALESVQADADPEPFYALIIDACIDSIKEHIVLSGGQ